MFRVVPQAAGAFRAARRRAGAPFVAVDCTSLSGPLMQSQLFGHEVGAFTGAQRAHVGFIRTAHGGTLMLDEIGELDADLQARLLRFLQEREVVPLGSTRAIPVNVRVIAATHRNLDELVREGKFRLDLFYRLNVLEITVAPLRERPQQILPLAQHFLRLQASTYDEPMRSLSQAAAEALLAYTWPGNVRELANVIEHASAFAVGTQILLQDLPVRLQTRLAESVVAAASLDSSAEAVLDLGKIERETIRRALEISGGRLTHAARMLGIEARRLRRKINRHGLCP